ncbi:MAG: histone deacetylase family protein [Rhodospirillaceae bacterium]|jgi:acetoin utilization deacetylase AcuC-like enzyme|nr:histone deacetylase family protein [Rhodospirillaceae bacterium]MBT3883974.1 histone deacetylase family protein [Rhodospirillaceae bacterium]MBT4117269.1 histone deacetylase family protein [Rhodospirillaceae bacterium]MBT4672179.1 histone deacetylase family protein [Rhodospirillaceae bacterium]MBT4749136.1 histone deacetylase family protein [Rhodospirillaceae bacterium]
MVRLQALLARLKDVEFGDLQWELAPKALPGQILAVHEQSYIEKVMAKIPAAGRAEFDPSGTVISAQSEDAIWRAPGAVCAAVDAVTGGRAGNAFCAVRPPGHHAKKAQTSGFCFFNNVAVGVRHLQETYGVRKVAVIDFDVHHGNGTQALLEKDPDVFFASIHQGNIFPNTGPMGVSELGNVINIPVARRYSGDQFLAVLQDRILPPMRAFGPEFIFLSAGFDAHLADPIGDLALGSKDFGRLTRAILDIARTSCDGRVVSVLEGGYAPGAVAAGAAAHVAELITAATAKRPQKIGKFGYPKVMT